MNKIGKNENQTHLYHHRKISIYMYKKMFDMPSLENWEWSLKIFDGTNSHHPCEPFTIYTHTQHTTHTHTKPPYVYCSTNYSPSRSKGKLDKKSCVKLRFVGYSQHRNGYFLFNEDGKKIVIKYDVTFNETNFAIEQIQIELTTQ